MSNEGDNADMEIPFVDKRQYKHMTLQSKSHTEISMDVLLISDPTTDKASAAIDIYVGQLCDSLPGIAHYLEHMLFIGTSKYPIENAYDQYLNTHGGSSNAFTDLEHTCYYFDVQAENFAGALDRFAQCFISPLMGQSALEREIQAVDSEHAKNIMQDQWRIYQLSKSKISPPSYAYGQFGSGNAKSLPMKVEKQNDNEVVSIREILLEFFDIYYRKNLQLYKLVILGKESIDELQSMMETYFGELITIFEQETQDKPPQQRSDVLQELYPKIPTQSSSFWNVPQQLKIIPVSQVHALEIQFPMREILSLRKNKPTRYLSHLLGHEGKGSLLSLLKSKQYATELYSDDSSRSCVSWSIFTVRIELTELGLQHVYDVVSMMFAYIDLLRQSGPQEWIYHEIQTVGEIQFRFLSQRNPMDYTCSIAGWMQQYPSSQYLSGAYKVYEWNPQLITECITSLTPDNMLLMISSPTFGEDANMCTEEEPWYGTKYCNVDCDETLWNDWKTIRHDQYPELQLPEVNDMIATNFDILVPSSDDTTKYPKDQPQCIHKDDNMIVWYKPDNVFDMPKVNIMLSFTNGHGPFSPYDLVAAHLFAELVQDHCNEFSYQASMAGLHCDISPTSTGMELHVSGYSHKAHVLVERLVNTIMDMMTKEGTDEDENNSVDSDIFDRIKFQTEQRYQSFLVAQPYQHAIDGGDLVMEKTRYSTHDKLNVLKDISLEDVLAFAKVFWKYCRLEGLIHGNVSAQHAYDITSVVWKKTHPKQPKSSEAIITRAALEKRVVDLTNVESLPKGKSSFLYSFSEYNEENINSCVEIVLQMGPLDLKMNATLAFVNHLIQEPAFNQLRTEEQLGYIVHTSVKTSGDNIKGLLFLIQSDGFDPNHVETRIETFLANFRQTIADMSDEVFQTNIDSVVASFLEKNKNLGEESSRYWHVILNKTCQFHRYQNLAEHVRKLSKDHVLQFYDDYVAAGGKYRKKLCIQVVAKQHADALKKEQETKDSENGSTLVRIEDPAEFKRSMPLFAMPPKFDIKVVDLGINKG